MSTTSCPNPHRSTLNWNPEDRSHILRAPRTPSATSSAEKLELLLGRHSQVADCSVLKLEVAAVPALAVAAVLAAAGQVVSATTKSISVSHAEHAIINNVGLLWWPTVFCNIKLWLKLCLSMRRPPLLMKLFYWNAVFIAAVLFHRRALPTISLLQKKAVSVMPKKRLTQKEAQREQSAKASSRIPPCIAKDCVFSAPFATVSKRRCLPFKKI